MNLRSWRTKRNFELFSGPDFVAALYEHVPPKGFQTLRYYGTYSNKARGLRKQTINCSGLKSQPSALKRVAPPDTSAAGASASSPSGAATP